MANVTINGASFTDVPAIVVPQTGGGIVQFTDVGATTATATDVAQGKVFFDALGVQTIGTASGGGGTGFEYLGQLYDHTWKLSDTGFNTWTPSSAAKAILTGADANTFVATDLANNEYWSQWHIEINVVYNSGTAVAKAMLNRVIGQTWHTITRRASNITNLDAGTKNTNIADSLLIIWIEHYATSATAWTVAYSPSYGLYPASVTPALSSTATSPTVTVKYPTIYARTSSTYMTAAMANAMDKDKSTIRMVCDIWRSTNVGYRKSLIYDQLIDQWQNGLPSM